MATRNLTDKDIKRAKPAASVTRLRDGNVKGLHLTITPAGTKSWALAFTSPETRKRRYYQLGGLADTKADETDNCLTLAGARGKAREVRSFIDNEGIDPIEQDARDAEAERQAEIDANTGTIEQLFKLYRIDMQLDKKRSADQIWGAYKYNVKDAIGHMKAVDVTKDDIADIIAEVAERAPVQANRIRTYMHSAFSFGLNYTTDARWRKKWRNGEVPDFKLQYNPVSATKRNGKVERVRKRNLSKDEVKRLWSSIGVDALSADLAIAVKLILSTGQRVEEILHAEWSEFDLEDKVWIIPAERRKSRHKDPVDHLVPLTEPQVALVEELRGITGHKQYLFPHRDCDNPEKQDKPRSCDSLSQAVHRYCRPGEESTREAFEPFVPKDLRRTWKTLAGSIGLSLEIRNRVQGHAFGDIGSKHYDQWEYADEKRRAVEKYSRWLDQLVTGKTAKVVKLEVAS